MQLKHFDHDGRARFITFCTHQKMPLLTNNVFRRALADTLDEIRQVYSIKLLAYVFMPEHVHLVLIPPTGVKIGSVIGELKRISAKRIHWQLSENKSPLLDKLSVVRNGKKRFALWQRRCYDHNCRDEQSVLDKIEYCHKNPVRRGLVRNPEDWRWSSAQWYRGHQGTVLTMDWQTEDPPVGWGTGKI